MSLYISASSINNYLSCSMKNFLRVNFKEEEALTTPLWLGILVHEVIESKWNSPTEAFKLAEKKKKEYNLDTANYRKAVKHLETFFNHFSSYLTDKDEIEKEFRFQLGDDVILLGKLDRVTPSGLVFDWKTSNTIPRDISTNPQFVLYNYAYRRLYDRPPQAVYFASLKTGQLVQYKYDVAVENALLTEVIPKMVDDIKNNRYARDGMFNYVSQCKYCTFQEFCINELASGDHTINQRRHKS